MRNGLLHKPQLSHFLSLLKSALFLELALSRLRPGKAGSARSRKRIFPQVRLGRSLRSQLCRRINQVPIRACRGEIRQDRAIRTVVSGTSVNQM